LEHSAYIFAKFLNHNNLARHSLVVYRPAQH
jgi:hypothetical protein